MYEIDHVFETIHIDSYLDVDYLFKKNIKQLMSKNNNDRVGNGDRDQTIIQHINDNIKGLNSNISLLSGIKYLEEQLKPDNNKFIEPNISVSIKSEIAVTGLFSNIVPYIHQKGDDNLYPTSGEGRRKMLGYSVYDILAQRNSEKKIILFFIEEPENHLHKSMQILLSQIIFSASKYNYLFVTTHSSYILYEMDNVNLIRIFSERGITSKSVIYQVPEEFKDKKKLLNRMLSEAIFASHVLLVEGPSEEILFNRVLTALHPNYETNGIYILPIYGVGFQPYLDILRPLGIKTIVKTDNDLRKIKGKNQYSVLGLIRCNKCVGKEILAVDPVEKSSVEFKRELYEKNKNELDQIREEYSVYMSKVDLENDLFECLNNRLSELLDEADPVKFLQESKHYNMHTLINKLNSKDCSKIFEHYNFACLKRVVNETD